MVFLPLMPASKPIYAIFAPVSGRAEPRSDTLQLTPSQLEAYTLGARPGVQSLGPTLWELASAGRFSKRRCSEHDADKGSIRPSANLQIGAAKHDAITQTEVDWFSSLMLTSRPSYVRSLPGSDHALGWTVEAKAQ